PARLSSCVPCGLDSVIRPTCPASSASRTTTTTTPADTGGGGAGGGALAQPYSAYGSRPQPASQAHAVARIGLVRADLNSQGRPAHADDARRRLDADVAGTQRADFA